MKRLTALILSLIMALSLCACGAKTVTEVAETESETVIDLVGREVAITPGSYSRIVCIGAGALRMYCYVGDTALLCGVEDIDNTSLEDRPKMFDSVARPYVLAYGDVFQNLPSCGVGGPQAQTAEAEKILSCDPDLVISGYSDADKSNALQEQLGVPVLTLSTGSGGVFDEAFSQSMTLLGKVLGQEARAEEVNAYVAEEAAEITTRTADMAEEDKPGVYICGLGNWGTTDHLMTAENYVSFDIANVRNVLSGTGLKGVQSIEAEAFVSLGEDMDIMVMDAAAVKNIIPLYQEDPSLFDTCKAWQTGNVYLEMAYNAYYTNFEISLINTWFIAKTVYPEAFADVDITEKTNEVTKMFLNAQLAEDIFACPSSFGGYQKIDTGSFFS